MRKKFLSIVACVLCVTMNLNAQSYGEFGTVKGEKMSKSSFYYGRFDEGGLDFNFSLGADFIGGQYVMDNVFVQGGLGVLYGGYGIDQDYRNGVDYTEGVLSIPVAAGYNLPLGEKSSLELYTGPRLNYTIYGKVETKVNGETYKKKYKDIDGIERFQVNWNIGASLLFGSWGITAEYRPALNDDFADFFHIGIIFR